MRIVQDFDDKKLESIVEKFYKYFLDGYEFETFLKPFFENLGLSEVVKTNSSRDGGVDLFAVKNGLNEFSDKDKVFYKVQAKRNLPSSLISPEKIDALRGNLGFNEKGLFITTARVSKKAKEDAASKDPSKPVIVIDGVELVRICIKKQIGFAYSPVFSKSALDEFTNKNDNTDNNLNVTDDGHLQKVSKRITTNDIRCKIISVPRFILNNLNNNEQKQNVKLIVNDVDTYDVVFCPSRNYLSSVTELLRKYGMLLEDGSIIEANSIWSISNNIIYLAITNS